MGSLYWIRLTRWRGDTGRVDLKGSDAPMVYPPPGKGSMLLRTNHVLPSDFAEGALRGRYNAKPGGNAPL